MELIVAILVLFLLAAFFHGVTEISSFFRKIQIKYRKKVFNRKMLAIMNINLEEVYEKVKLILKDDLEKVGNAYFINQIKTTYNLLSFEGYTYEIIGLDESKNEIFITLFKESSKPSFILKFSQTESKWEFIDILLASQKNLKKVYGIEDEITKNNRIKLFFIDNLFYISYMLLFFLGCLFILFTHYVGMFFHISYIYCLYIGISISNLIVFNHFLQQKSMKYIGKSDSEKSKNPLGYFLIFSVIVNGGLMLFSLVGFLETEKEFKYRFDSKGIYTSSPSNKVLYNELPERLKLLNNSIDHLKLFAGKENRPRLSKITNLFYGKRVYPFTGIYVTLEGDSPIFLEVYEKGKIKYDIKIKDYRNYEKTYYYDNNKNIDEISTIVLEDDINVEGDDRVNTRTLIIEDVKAYDLEGRLRQEVILTNGEINGKNKKYDESGKLILDDIYSNNKFSNWVQNECREPSYTNGIDKFWNEKLEYGKKHFKEDIIKNKLKKVIKDEKIYSGENKEYYSSGEIKKEEYFKDGEGYTKRYYKNGNIEAEGIYLKEGYSGFKFYTKRGYLDKAGIFKNGIKYEGYFIERNDDEEINVEEWFNIGFGRVKKFSDGIKYCSGEIKNGKKEGTWYYTIYGRSFSYKFKNGIEIEKN